MTETVQNGDFVELDYTGIIKDGNIVFDTTMEDTAKKEDIFDPKMSYGPVSLCVGQHQILQGLDGALEGLEIGKETEVTLPPEKAFGKKDGKLMKLVPTSAFKKQGINPMPGLQINIDGAIGIVRTASGGRCVVDFNNPLAGKEITYRILVKRKLTEDKDKVRSLVVLALNQKDDAVGVLVEGGKAVIDVKQEFPEPLLNIVRERITNLLPQIKDVEFKMPAKKVEKKESKAEEKPADSDVQNPTKD